ncbi:MAG TPA: hypothetical protein VG710_00115, partial [Opitutus sp.]|nr:hypothetical protein [Opitutus sp.]
IHALPAMKLVSILTRVAVGTAAALAIAILFNTLAGAAYAIATSAFLLLIVARDYSPRAQRWQPRLAPTHRTPPGRKNQSLRLAA